MTGDLPAFPILPEDPRVVTVVITGERAERWIAAASAAGFPGDLSGWLRSLADRAAGLR